MPHTVRAPMLLLLLLLLLHSALVSNSLPNSEKLTLMQHEGAEGEHDSNFDKEMLFGSGESNSLAGLNHEQAEKKLGELFDSSIDADKNGKVSRQELLQWLERVADKQLQGDSRSYWAKLNVSDGQLLTWPAYALAQLESHSMTKAALQQVQQDLKAGKEALSELPSSAAEADKLALKSLRSDLTSKQRRWKAADANKDGKLSESEFHRFAFPEEFDDTRPLVVEEELERLDKNRDGKVSLAEFIADLWNPSKQNEEAEPDWVQHERTDFKTRKDANKDGFLDRKELEKYLFDHESKADLFKKEADHLLAEADKDKDLSLSKQEMLNSIDVLAGSAATNFGQHLREEL